MTDAMSLIKILSRINDRMENCNDTIDLIHSICKRRAEAEEQFANALQQIVPTAYDKGNPVIKAFISEMNFEVSNHRNLAAGIRKQILPSSSQYSAQIIPKRKEIQKLVNSNLADLHNKWTTVTKHRQWIMEAEAKLVELPLNKQPSQQKYIEKLYKNAQKPEMDFTNCLSSVGAAACESISPEFRVFEKQRVMKEREFTVLFAQLKSDLMSLLNTKNRNLVDTLSNIDLGDRSNQYVNRLLNPSIENVTFEDEVVVYAYAISDFLSDDQKDLQLKLGDKIRVIKQNPSGWNEGELNGKKGFYPSTYTMIPKVSNSQIVAINSIFVANKNYIPKRAGDMKVLVGDMIFVDFIKETKCSGQNLRTKQSGYFQIDILDIPK